MPAVTGSPGRGGLRANAARVALRVGTAVFKLASRQSHLCCMVFRDLPAVESIRHRGGWYLPVLHVWMEDAGMEHFSTGGVFWLPDAAGRRIPGDLMFDADGARLVLHDSLEAAEDEEDVGVAPQWRTFGAVHGQLHDGRRATLLDVAGMSLSGPFDIVREDWSARFAPVGGWTDGAEFGLAMFSFDALLPWADPPAAWHRRPRASSRSWST